MLHVNIVVVTKANWRGIKKVSYWIALSSKKTYESLTYQCNQYISLNSGLAI